MTVTGACEGENGSLMDMKEEIINIIHENYVHDKLSLSYVASRVKLSETNLSHIFKEQTGVNFSEYVEGLRINKACELILNSSLSMEKIAEETGYCSVYSFRRAFKRRKGVIPSNLRREVILIK